MFSPVTTTLDDQIVFTINDCLIYIKQEHDNPSN